MAHEIVHEEGCDRRHTRRQRCNGPIAEALRVNEAETAWLEAPDFADVRDPWPIISPKLCAVFELVPGASVVFLWLASRPQSIKYSDFEPLVWLAILPSLGWLLRWRAGCIPTLGAWVARVGFIPVAVIMWGLANDHQGIKLEDSDITYQDYCCRPAWSLGTHLALAGAVGVSVFSAYVVSKPLPDED